MWNLANRVPIAQKYFSEILTDDMMHRMGFYLITFVRLLLAVKCTHRKNDKRLALRNLDADADAWLAN